jgi:rRNA pseudouridine-1189 N-methylase Emg1 (Nep1/Mra1 family)
VEHATRVPEEPLRFSRLLSEVLSKMKQDEARVKYKVLHPTSMLLWMEEILHQLIDGLSHYL